MPFGKQSWSVVCEMSPLTEGAFGRLIGAPDLAVARYELCEIIR